jgi:predicted amidohydrolase
MMETVKVALVQLNVGSSIGENVKVTEALIREAAKEGAKFILTPENTCHIRNPAIEKLKSSYYVDAHPNIEHFSSLAHELGIWLLVGSMTIKISDDKVANRSFLFDNKGKVAATYDKIHLFDVDLSTGESHRESDNVLAGDKAVIANTPWCDIGLTICYDLRFSYLYRHLAKQGAKIICAPAAFTVPTGMAHWEVLLRARAIETGSFILAPAQCGEHEGGRKTYGHSLIVGPWGQVLADAGDSTGLISCDLDLSLVDQARESIPALLHDRQFG